jgi:hypothetical protein
MANIIFILRILRLQVFLGSVLFCSTAAADWAESSDPLVVSPAPRDGSEEIQNPPGFSWARAPGAQGYELVLRGPGNEEQVWQASRNWFLPSSHLKPGEYTWKVRPKGSNGPWSNLRRFSLSPRATLFEVPPEEKLLQFIRARSRPRSRPPGEKGTDESVALVRAQKAPIIQALDSHARAYAGEPVIDERSVMLVPKSRDEKAWAISLATINSRTSAESYQLRVAALLWRTTGNRFYLEEAKRRGNALAALDPGGSTSHVNQDQGNRTVAWGLTVAYDYLSDDLLPGESAAWLGVIKSRTAAIYSDLKSEGWRLEQTPLDSHGSTNLGYLAAISAVMIDSIPDAEDWFRNSFRFYVHYQSPWGGEEGGYANGTAYAQYSVDLFVDFWDSIAASTGVSMYEKPWSRGLLKFLACFIPPGSPSHNFGDAAETKPWTTALKAFANRYNDNLALWYSENLIGEEGALSKLTNPILHASPSMAGKSPEGNACVFSHIGWTAMHSHWANPSRTSVYFKSSPYAAFNHSHADNNSFVLVSGGEQLLIDSGYYDWYGSPHWKGWYRQTKAHNAVTFDNGRGEAEKSGPDRMTAVGRLVEFHSDGNVDFVEGDASAAYEGELTQARRRLWYLRNENVVVIHDSLRSAVPRQFEWNIHALDRFVVKTQVSVEVKQNAASACIDMLQPGDIEFVQNNQFDPPPQSAPGRKDQWHGRFRNTERQTSMEFIAVIKVGCNAVPLKQDDFLSSRKITVGKTAISIPR